MKDRVTGIVSVFASLCVPCRRAMGFMITGGINGVKGSAIDRTETNRNVYCNPVACITRRLI